MKSKQVFLTILLVILVLTSVANLYLLVRVSSKVEYIDSKVRENGAYLYDIRYYGN